MKKIIITSIFIGLSLSSCSRKPVEKWLTQEILVKLNTEKINEISIHCMSKTSMPYSYYFLIDDPEKIDIFLRCMRQATLIKDKQRFDRPRKPFIFKTARTHYRHSIGWNEEVVYGDWDADGYAGRWESAELLQYFKQWQLSEKIAAADPHCIPMPPWELNPTPAIDPDSPWARIPSAKYTGVSSVDLTQDIISVFDPTKVIEFCLVTQTTEEEGIRVVNINDKDKIKSIICCIQDAAGLEYNPTRTSPNAVFYLITSKRVFSVNIGWHEQAVYGNWWKSESLLGYFREWNVLPPIKTSAELDALVSKKIETHIIDIMGTKKVE